MANELAKAMKNKRDAEQRLYGQTQKPVVIQGTDGTYTAPEPADYTATLAAGKNISISTSGTTKTINAVMGLIAGDNISISEPDSNGKVTITASGGSSSSIGYLVSTLTSEAIQTALNACEADGGGIVFLDAGNYTITSILQVPSNTKIVGIGNVTFTRMAEINAIIVNKADGTTGGYNANENIQVINIKFNCNNATYTTQCTIFGFGHANNIEVDNCEFYNANTSWHLLELNGVANAKINNCHFHDYTGSTELVQLDIADSSAAFPWFGPYDKTPCMHIEIIDCIFDGNGSSSIKAIGNHTFAAGYRPQYILIEGCTFNNFYYAISLQDVSNFTVNKNKFINCKIALYHTHQSNDISDWIISNNFHAQTYSADNVDNRFLMMATATLTKAINRLKVFNNIISGCHTHGIGITATKDVIIANNTIFGCGKNGVYLYGCEQASIINNVMYGNNLMSEAGRADIVIGNNSSVSANKILVIGNNIQTAIIGTNALDVVVNANVISSTLTNNAGAEGFTNGNLVNGAWTGGSAITKADVEAVLTGTISSHNHAAVYELPVGGTLGQVLKKKSATDRDVEWGDTSGSYTLPQATETVLGGIKAKAKTTESSEVAIDTTTGKLYAPAPDAAANGLPSGGTAGQILSKIDGTNYNVQWVDPPTGGGTGEAAYIMPSVADFETSRAGTGTISDTSKGVRIVAPSPSTNTNSLIYLLKTITAGANGWQATARIKRHTPLQQWGMMGMIVRNGTDGKSVTYATGNDSIIGINRNQYASDTSWNAVSGIVTFYGLDLWIRIKDDLTNRKVYISSDGEYWQQIYTEARTTYVTPDQVGVFINPNFGSTATQSINVRPEVGMEVLSWEFEQL